jgi:hypothetical protein
MAKVLVVDDDWTARVALGSRLGALGQTEDFVPLLRAVQRALGGTYTRS